MILENKHGRSRSREGAEGSDSLVKEYNWTGLGRPHHNVIELSSSLTINGRLLEKEHKIVRVGFTGILGSINL